MKQDEPHIKRSLGRTLLLPLDWVLAAFIKIYQYFISPLLGSNCRYQPTCSGYALTAIARFGAIRGGWLAAKRIAKCHPWGGFGYDPVPQSVSHFCEAPQKQDKSTVEAGSAGASLGVKSDG